MSQLEQGARVGREAFVGCYIKPQQRRALAEIAQREDRSLSSVLRRAVASYVLDVDLAEVKAKAERFHVIGEEEK